MDIALYVLVAALLLLVVSIEQRIGRTDRRVARLEHKVDLVLEHLGISEAGPELAQVSALLREGKKIQAIKVYREVTGAGLKEAKEAVERMPGGR